jgi:hypothetical protein
MLPVTVDAQGRLTAASSGTAPVTSVTGTSPVTSSGGTTPAIGLALGYGDTQNPYASKTANYVLAAPNGSAGAPTFRALASADIPALSYVSSVEVTAPLASTGGLTPTLSIPAANTTTSGYLTSTDWNTFNSKGSGTVTAVSVASANGFAGSSSGGATPALTISTSVTGVLKGNGTAISAATAGTDYSAGTSALATGILKSTTTTGALSIAVAADFPTLNQNTTGTASNVTGTVAIANGGTGQTSANAAFNALAPSQTSNSGKYLTTDGTNTSWATPSASLTVTNDTTTATTLYPTFTSSTGTNITGVSVTSTKLTFVPSTGALVSTSVAGSSDARLKEDVQPISDALSKVNGLQGVSYIRNDIDDKSRQIGLIAQDVEKIIPEVVLTDENGYKAIAYGNLVGLLIESVKELSAEVKSLKAQLEAK